MFRGHWLSGTRKLNHHYQSGQGGESSFVLSEFRGPVMGFEYSGQGERYYSSDDRFYSSATEKVIVAELYLLEGGGLPTTYTQEIKHALYSNWTVNGSNRFAAGTYRWNVDIPVWKYTEHKAYPHWAYSQSGLMLRVYKTVDDNRYNQNGISMTPNSYTEGTSSSFETMYDSFEADVVEPIYEIVAMPDSGFGQQMVILTDDTDFSNTYPNDMKFVGYKKNGIERVWCGGTDGVRSYVLNDGNAYVANIRRGYSETTEIVALPNPGVFAGRVLYVPIRDDNGNFISAGQYTDPDTGIISNMVYFVRCVRLEKGTYELPLQLLSESW